MESPSTLSEVVRGYLDGDKGLRNAIINMLIPMVTAIARRYYPEQYDEAYSYGLYHLVIAVDRFPKVAVDDNIQPYAWVIVKKGIHSDLYCRRKTCPIHEHEDEILITSDLHEVILRDILESLGKRLRDVAIYLMRGYTQKEIARAISCSERDTSYLVETVLGLLRREINNGDE